MLSAQAIKVNLGLWGTFSLVGERRVNRLLPHCTLSDRGGRKYRGSANLGECFLEKV